MYVGEWIYSSAILDLCIRWMWMVSFAYRRLYPLGKRRWYFLDRKICELQNQSGHWGIEKKFLLCQDSKTGLPTHTPSLYRLSYRPYVQYGLYFLPIDVLLSSHFSFIIVQNLVVKTTVLFHYCKIFTSYCYYNYYTYRYVCCFVVLKICDNDLASLSEEFLVIKTGLSSRLCIWPRFLLLFVLVMVSYICIIWRVSVRHIWKRKAQSAYEMSSTL